MLIDIDTGALDVLTTAIPAPNFPTVTPWDTLLVSDANDAIWEVDAAGTTTEWLAIDGPNGTAFSSDGRTLWAVNTWNSPAPVWQIAIDGEQPGAVTEVASFDGGNFPDGVALGASGDLYVSLNLTGLVARVTPEGNTETVAEGVDYTASIAFPPSGMWDPCSLYSTSLFGPSVFRVSVGEPGLP